MAQAAGASGLPADVLDTLSRRTYRGNVRELKNAVDAFLAIGVLPEEGSLASDGLLSVALRRFVDTRAPFGEQRDRVVELFTRLFVAALLRETGNNLSEAARRCGLERSYLGKLARRHGLKT